MEARQGRDNRSFPVKARLERGREARLRASTLDHRLFLEAVPGPSRRRWFLAVAQGLVFAACAFGLLGWLQPPLEGTDSLLHATHPLTHAAVVSLAFHLPEVGPLYPPVNEEVARPPEEWQEASKGRTGQRLVSPKRIPTRGDLLQPIDPRGAGEEPPGLFPSEAVRTEAANRGAALPLQPSGGAREGEGTRSPERQRDAKGLRSLRRTSVMEISMLKVSEAESSGPRRVVKAPRASYQPKPKYPSQAEKKEIEGSLRVKVLISDKGTVVKHEILAAEPPGIFEKTIEEVIPFWQYTPAQDEAGKPIECWKEYSYVFRLEDVGR